MRNPSRILLVGLLTLGLAVPSLAQQSFDVKKRANQTINKSSLNATKINGTSGSTAGRSGAKNSIVKKSQQLIKPRLNQPQLKVYYSKDTGLPSFIRSPRTINSSSRIGLKRDVTTATYEYLEELKTVLQVERAGDFSIRKVSTGSDNSTYVRMEQMHKGIPVYGAEVVVHLDANGDGESFNGKYLSITENIDPIPVISEQAAVQRAVATLKKGKPMRGLSEIAKKLVQYAEPKATLCIYQDKGIVKSNVLAYHVVSCPSLYERWEYFVDASTGAVLHQFESICAVDGPRTATGPDLNGISRSINTYQSGSNYFLVDISRTMYEALGSVLPDEPIGGILTIDMNNTFGEDQKVQHVMSSNNSWPALTQTKGLSAHFNAGVAYEYFRTNHNRNSIDGDDGTIISIVNVPDEDGNNLDNAYWNGKAMFYGNGDVEFKPLAGGMDVAGHELTHGVVQNTANLEYEGESGAINESMADIFGSMMDPADWLIGEDVVKAAVFPSGAMRSMSNPHNGGTTLGQPGYQPMHTSEAYTGTQDNGGVHINSGIPNHAFYLFAEEISRDKAADVYYLALKEYLTKSSQFIDLRLAVIKAAADLYGAGSPEVIQAGLAFDAVGITNGEGGDYTETLPGNPGTEFMLVYNTDISNSQTLYRTKLDGTDATALTTTTFLNKPSVTDKGDVAVFVASDHKIHAIKITPGSTPVETILYPDAIWSNVVISKGGSKLAAVTTDQEPKIYVYDFATAAWGEFDLYNPTYSGVNSAGAVYADALEWDYNGEFLVYDCFNRIENTNGSAIEYWDVNFIHVWDSQTETFADGNIEKLFSSLPEGVSIGNPSFAKNSPNIIAFDYVDESIDKYLILGCNVETSDLETIVENETLGWPSYSKTDDRLAYTTLDPSGDYNTAYVLLNPDKITPADDPEGLFGSTKWPVFFATGEREIGDEVITDVPTEIATASGVSCFPNPFQREVIVEVADPTLTQGRVIVVNTLGQRVYDFAAEVQDDQHLILNLENLKSGQYFMHLSGARKNAGCKLVKK